MKLYINNIEYDFHQTINVVLHPYNPSTIVFNEVIPKTQNIYPLNTKTHYINEMSIARIYDDNNNLLLMGPVTATGRLNLDPNTIKTQSVEIKGFNYFLNSKPSIDDIVYDVTPEELLDFVIEKMEDNTFIKGDVRFQNNKQIKQYNLVNKSPYSILKDVIATIGNALLYFTFTNDGKVVINYKPLRDLVDESPTHILDGENFENWSDIKKIDASTTTEKYANVVKIESNNITSKNINQQIFNEIETNKDYELGGGVGEFIFNKCIDGNNKELKIIRKDEYDTGVFQCDAFYVDNKICFVEETLKTPITITWHPIFRTAVVVRDDDEIERISKNNICGEIVHSEVYNDIRDLNSLLNKARHLLRVSTGKQCELKITKTKMDWKLLEKVLITQSGKLDGNFFVQKIVASIDLINEANNEINYTLKSYLNFDELQNYFDNQTFRADYSIPDIINTILYENETNYIFALSSYGEEGEKQWVNIAKPK